MCHIGAHNDFDKRMRKEEQMAAEIDCDNCDVKDKCRCASFYGDVHCLLVTDRSHTIPLDLLVMPNQDRTPPNPGSDAALDRGCTCPVLDHRKLSSACGITLADNWRRR